MPLLVHAGDNIVKGDSCLAVYGMAQALRLLQPDSTAMFLCHRGLAESFYGMKNYTAFLSHFEEAVRYNFASLTSYYYAAVCAEATGDKDSACRWLSTFIKLAEKEAEPTEELRKLLTDAKKKTVTTPSIPPSHHENEAVSRF